MAFSDIEVVHTGPQSEYGTHFYGWDVESTVWLRWRVGGVEPIGDIEWTDSEAARY